MASCIGGGVVGWLIGSSGNRPTQPSVTQVTVYQLAITQLIGLPTYTPYPTYTQPPPSLSETSFRVSPKASFTPAALPIPSLTPTPLGIELVNLSWNVYPNQEAFIVIKTVPGTRCSIRYSDPLGQAANLASLADQFADENGHCAWKWLIAPRAKPGSARVTVTAMGMSATYLIQVQSGTPNP